MDFATVKNWYMTPAGNDMLAGIRSQAQGALYSQGGDTPDERLPPNAQMQALLDKYQNLPQVGGIADIGKFGPNTGTLNGKRVNYYVVGENTGEYKIDANGNVLSNSSQMDSNALNPEAVGFVGNGQPVFVTSADNTPVMTAPAHDDYGLGDSFADYGKFALQAAAMYGGVKGLGSLAGPTLASAANAAGGAATDPWAFANEGFAQTGANIGTGAAIPPGISALAKAAESGNAGALATVTGLLKEYPMLGTALAASAGPIIGALISNSSANEAIGAQEGATAASIDEVRRQFDQTQGTLQGQQAQTRADFEPWRQAGGQAVTQLGQMLGVGTDNGSGSFGSLNKKFTLADFWDDPVTKASYQSGLDLGEKGVRNMAASRGALNSGATLKALTRFGTDYTGNQAAGSQARFVGDQNNTYNRLAGLAGTGQAATNSVANAGQSTANNIATAGTNTANNVANLTSGLGNARGAAAISSGNAFANAGNTIGNYFSQQNQLDQFLKSRQPTVASAPTLGNWYASMYPQTDYGLS